MLAYDTLSLEELGFLEIELVPERHVGTARIIFFAKTPVEKRGPNYYAKMIRHIVCQLRKRNITFDHIIIDWAPENFSFIPQHEHYNRFRDMLYFHVKEAGCAGIAK